VYGFNKALIKEATWTGRYRNVEGKEKDESFR
jgi:hypothetical protein